ncbi:MAG: hypothetical protein OK457_06575 [Thaumarchaeota archaeon]|nr:hypothetical protein [Nitrososphaerota archaeon]
MIDLDPEKNKKLQQYATILNDQAKEAERAGKPEDAIKHYLKLVDVFLVLAAEAPDHNTWLQYIRQAEAYQTRIKSLVPGQLNVPDISGRVPPAPEERGTPTQQPRREISLPENNPQAQSGNPARPGAFNKILKPFQRVESEEQGPPASMNTAQSKIQSSVPLPPRPQVSQSQQAQVATQKQTPIPVENMGPIPHELYERALSENRILHERLQSIMKENDEKIAFLESRTRELEERVAMMVPRPDYDMLREEFDNTVPKHEYDRMKSELAGMVPISHYDQLLDRISGMVPREVYSASEKRILELEEHLRRSVPFTVIDELANEVSYLSIVAEVPPNIEEEGKKEEPRKESELDLVSAEGK